MAQMRQTTLRLSAIQFAQLARLSEKLQINQADVIRVAISRLAAEEGVVIPPPKRR